MENNNRRPILVIGAHRSGSTWVGQMIARSPEVGYIHEPFNINPGSGICGGQFEYWFTYVCETNASGYYDHLNNCLNFRCSIMENFKANRNPRNIIYMLGEWIGLSVDRLQRKRPLLKDPLAVFSAEWLSHTFDMEVIVLIRHPAAFAGSIKKANWPHPFRHFLNQPLLMRDFFSEFAAEIEEFSTNEKDIIDQAILLWNLIHSAIITYRNNYADWFFIRHEDIATDPIGEFAKIFQKLSLDFPITLQEEIMQYSKSKNNDEKADLLSIRRNSKATTKSWRNRLTEEEIRRVRTGTAKICSNFYDDEYW